MYASIIVAVDPGTPADAAIATAGTIARAVGCRLRTVHYDTDPAAAILALQAAAPDSLLCMATSARTGLGEVAFGSTASEVVRKTEHAVLLVGPNARAVTRIERLLVCLDGSDEATAGATTAAVWALLLGAQVHLVRVAPPSTAGDPHDSVADLAALAHDLRTSIAVHPEWEVLHDDHPAAALVEYAASLPASLIFMTTRGRADMVGRVLGSTGMRVVRDAPCPVLLVHQTTHEGSTTCS